MREPRYPLPRVVLTFTEDDDAARARTVFGAAGARSFVRVPWRKDAPVFVGTPGSGLPG